MDRICRLCLGFSKEKLNNIFQCKLKYSENSLVDVLFWIFSVEVDVTDPYPKDVCNDCKILIEYILEIKNGFQTNQKLLKNQSKDEVYKSIYQENNTELSQSRIQFSTPAIPFTIPINNSSKHKKTKKELNEVKLSIPTINALCPVAVEIERFEDSQEYSRYKPLGDGSFKSRKSRHFKLDETVLDEICNTLDYNEFESFSEKTVVNSKNLRKNEKKIFGHNEDNGSLPVLELSSLLGKNEDVKDDKYLDIKTKNTGSSRLSSNGDKEFHLENDWTSITFRKDASTNTNLECQNNYILPKTKSVGTNFKLDLRAPYPQLICRKCLTEIENIRLFREELLRNQELLFTLFKASNYNDNENKEGYKHVEQIDYSDKSNNTLHIMTPKGSTESSEQSSKMNNPQYIKVPKAYLDAVCPVVSLVRIENIKPKCESSLVYVEKEVSVHVCQYCNKLCRSEVLLNSHYKKNHRFVNVARKKFSGSAQNSLGKKFDSNLVQSSELDVQHRLESLELSRNSSPPFKAEPDTTCDNNVNPDNASKKKEVLTHTKLHFLQNLNLFATHDIERVKTESVAKNRKDLKQSAIKKAKLQNKALLRRKLKKQSINILLERSIRFVERYGWRNFKRSTRRNAGLNLSGCSKKDLPVVSAIKGKTISNGISKKRSLPTKVPNLHLKRSKTGLKGNSVLKETEIKKEGCENAQKLVVNSLPNKIIKNLQLRIKRTISSDTPETGRCTPTFATRLKSDDLNTSNTSLKINEDNQAKLAHVKNTIKKELVIKTELLSPPTSSRSKKDNRLSAQTTSLVNLFDQPEHVLPKRRGMITKNISQSEGDTKLVTRARGRPKKQPDLQSNVKTELATKIVPLKRGRPKALTVKHLDGESKGCVNIHLNGSVRKSSTKATLPNNSNCDDTDTLNVNTFYGAIRSVSSEAKSVSKEKGLKVNMYRSVSSESIKCENAKFSHKSMGDGILNVHNKTEVKVRLARSCSPNKRPKAEVVETNPLVLPKKRGRPRKMILSTRESAVNVPLPIPIPKTEPVTLNTPREEPVTFKIMKIRSSESYVDNEFSSGTSLHFKPQNKDDSHNEKVKLKPTSFSRSVKSLESSSSRGSARFEIDKIVLEQSCSKKNSGKRCSIGDKYDKILRSRSSSNDRRLTFVPAINISPIKRNGTSKSNSKNKMAGKHLTPEKIHNLEELEIQMLVSTDDEDCSFDDDDLSKYVKKEELWNICDRDLNGGVPGRSQPAFGAFFKKNNIVQSRTKNVSNRRNQLLVNMSEDDFKDLQVRKGSVDWVYSKKKNIDNNNTQIKTRGRPKKYVSFVTCSNSPNIGLNNLTDLELAQENVCNHNMMGELQKDVQNFKRPRGRPKRTDLRS